MARISPSRAIARRFDLMIRKMLLEALPSCHTELQVNTDAVTMEIRWYIEKPEVVVLHAAGLELDGNLADGLKFYFLLYGRIILLLEPESHQSGRPGFVMEVLM